MDKKEYSQDYINRLKIRLNNHEKDMKEAKKGIDEFMEKGKYYWVDVACKRFQDSYNEWKALKKTIEEMENLLNFITREEEEANV